MFFMFDLSLCQSEEISLCKAILNQDKTDWRQSSLGTGSYTYMLFIKTEIISFLRVYSLLSWVLIKQYEHKPAGIQEEPSILDKYLLNYRPASVDPNFCLIGKINHLLGSEKVFNFSWSKWQILTSQWPRRKVCSAATHSSSQFSKNVATTSCSLDIS